MNYSLFSTINSWSGTRLLDTLMRFAARDLIFAVFAVFAALVLFVYLRKGLAPVAGSAVTLVLAFGFGLVAAALHLEKRPFQSHQVRLLIQHAPGQSFPSDHATAAFAVALASLVFLSRPIGAALLSLAVLIGLARVYCGLHYPGDILGSLLVSALALPFGVAVRRRLSRRRRRTVRPVRRRGLVSSR